MFAFGAVDSSGSGIFSGTLFNGVELIDVLGALASLACSVVVSTLGAVTTGVVSSEATGAGTLGADSGVEGFFSAVGLGCAGFE